MKLAAVFLIISSISQAFALGSNLEPDKFSVSEIKGSGNQLDPDHVDYPASGIEEGKLVADQTNITLIEGQAGTYTRL